MNKLSFYSIVGIYILLLLMFLRPMNVSEKKQGCLNLISVVTDKREIVVKEKCNSIQTRTFTFDKVRICKLRFFLFFLIITSFDI